MRTALTPHQRRVLVALAVNGVPIDVLAERLESNRNALYKTRARRAAQASRAQLAGGWLHGRMVMADTESRAWRSCVCSDRPDPS